MEKTEIFKQLMDQFLAGEIGRQDLERLQAMVRDEGLEAELDACLKESFVRDPVAAENTSWNNAFKNQLFIKIRNDEGAAPAWKVRARSIFPWRSAAAILLLLAGTATYLWFQQRHRQADTETVAALPDSTANKPSATLILADGTAVSLDSLKNGLIANQQGSNVIMQNGQLAYQPGGGSHEQVAYNTVNTPKGARFHMILPDGTGVWLNAASSIRYPTRFTGQDRKVEVTGETYFEVAANEKMPFHVTVGNRIDIGVLGTHFNINAYTNEESIQTTLLQGAVRVTAHHTTVTLSPGQQAVVGPAGAENSKIAVHQVDADKTITWKEGYFNLDEAGLREVMRQLERWYDIDVVYAGTIPETKFWGRISTDVPLDKLVRNLAWLGVHARLEGRRLTVMP